MKGKGGKFQKKVSDKFLMSHGKMVDAKNQPTGKPVAFVYPSEAKIEAAMLEVKPVVEVTGGEQ